MPKLLEYCVECEKVSGKHTIAKVSHEYKTEVGLGGILRTYTTLECGHCLVNDVSLQEINKFKSLDGKKEVYPYQIDGIEFIIQTDFNCLLADGMGVGKTLQALKAVQIGGKLPVLVIQKAATTFQWMKETHDWISNSGLSVFPILGSQGYILPGFQVYVIPMDTFARKGVLEKLLVLGIKCVIIDECHSFKDSGSKRAQALVKFFKVSGIKHKIGLSGTPIKNRAAEYFTILNLIAPSYFPSEIAFKRDWLEQNEKGAYTRIKSWRIESFRELISKFVLRREKHEVLKDLPALRKSYREVYIDDENIKDTYNRQLGLSESIINGPGGMSSLSILGELAKLRKITALAKIKFALEYVEEFLENTEDEKIAIGIHHHDVRDELYNTLLLKGWNPLKLSGEDSPQQKDQIVRNFNHPNRRVMIISTLAGGVGLNLQMCANALVIERQWNSADEDQFDSRFHRNGQKQAVVADYMIAHGTIDEYFHDMVLEKAEIFKNTVGNEYNLMSDGDGIKELAERTFRGRL